MTLAAMGCGSESLYVTGPKTAAVGELSVFSVTADLPCGGKVFGGPSDPTGDLMICPQLHKITQVVAASCDGDACVVESIDPPDSNGYASVNVVGSVAGSTVLRLRAQLDDGSEMSASFSVAFATPTGLHVACGQSVVNGSPNLVPSGQCGGSSPVFTGASWRWTFSFDSDAGPLPAYPSITVQGSAVTFDETNDWFQAGAADGTAEVTIASRLFTEQVPVKVVSLADVVSGDVRRVTISDGIEHPIVDLGPAPTHWYPIPHVPFDGWDDTQAILSRLTLADGRQAYGGGGLFTSDHPEICYFYPLYQDQGIGLIQDTFVDPQCYAVGTATFSAMVGAAAITWSVTVAQATQ